MPNMILNRAFDESRVLFAVGAFVYILLSNKVLFDGENIEYSHETVVNSDVQFPNDGQRPTYDINNSKEQNNT